MGIMGGPIIIGNRGGPSIGMPIIGTGGVPSGEPIVGASGGPIIGTSGEPIGRKFVATIGAVHTWGTMVGMAGVRAGTTATCPCDNMIGEPGRELRCEPGGDLEPIGEPDCNGIGKLEGAVGSSSQDAGGCRTAAT